MTDGAGGGGRAAHPGSGRAAPRAGRLDARAHRRRTPALDRLRAGPFDPVILDIMLPGLDGLTVLKALSRDSKNTDVPVLLLTARREESDKVLGLESGADDYLAKPFGVAELVARARALMRRPRAYGREPRAAAAVRGLTVDPARRRVTVGERDVELTSHEFELLLLASHPGSSLAARPSSRGSGRATRS